MPIPLIVTEDAVKLTVSYIAKAREGQRWHWSAVDLTRGEPGDRPVQSGKAATSDDALRDARAAASVWRKERAA